MFTVRAARGFSIEFNNGYEVEVDFPYEYRIIDPLYVLEQILCNRNEVVEVHIYKKDVFKTLVNNEFIGDSTRITAEEFVDVLAEVKKR